MAVLLSGCASPGPPRAPSLQEPAIVSDLQATRRGNTVELAFAVPQRTTDGLPYRGGAIRATVCRAMEAGICVPVANLAEFSLGTGTAEAKLEDALPPELTRGAARLLTYRVELRNGQGRSAGFGDAAFSAAGEAPASVAGLHAEGSRRGVAVRWEAGGERSETLKNSGSDDVVLQREWVSGPGGEAAEHSQHTARSSHRAGAKATQKSGEPGVVWLSTAPVADPLSGEKPEKLMGDAHGALDDSAVVNDTYRYAAERQRTVQLGGSVGGPGAGAAAGGHTVVLHSQLSAPVEVTLRDVYPPPAPTDLVGTAFPLPPGEAAGTAGAQGWDVDLIWTPADDPKTVGYNIYREVMGGGGGTGLGSRRKLNPQPVKMPAYHDVLPAEPATGSGPSSLRYSVTSLDASGMESAPVVTVVETTGR